MNKQHVIVMSANADGAKVGKHSDRLAATDAEAVLSNAYFNKLAWKLAFGTALPEKVKVTIEPA